MAYVTKRTMKSILELRLKELQQKLAEAKTENEKLIYTEAIAHCVHDAERVKLSARRHKVIRIIVWLTFSLMLIVVWKLVLLHRSDESTIADESQSIGRAVTDSTN